MNKRGTGHFTPGVAALLCMLTACNDDPQQQQAPQEAKCDGGCPLAEAGPTGLEAGPAMEPDARTLLPPCRRDSECDDGEYCNGIERCEMGTPGDDGRGCVAATTEPCDVGQDCNEVTDQCECEVPDADGDGVLAEGCGGTLVDCDDNDPDRFPGNPEICDPDGHDEDCNPETYGIRDQDQDGEADGRCCNYDDMGTAYCGPDCDDTRNVVYEGNSETCDRFDNDCDGRVDEGVQVTFYEDQDADSYGSASDDALTKLGCPDDVFPAEGDEPAYKPNADDCNDSDSAINPAAGEACQDPGDVDEDCSGEIDDRPGGCSCQDGSTVPCARLGLCAGGVEQCVGGVPDGVCSVSPALEECTSLEQDEDCDGFVDEAPGAGIDDGLKLDCYPDPDLDGYAEIGATPTKVCGVAPGNVCPAGSTAVAPVDIGSTDCGEDDDTIGPHRTERCGGTPGSDDGVDEDCDGFVDEAPDAGMDGGLRQTCYVDQDGDGFSPSPAGAVAHCSCPANTTLRQPTNASNTDCDDAVGRDFINPDSSEVCSVSPERDEDCDGVIDEAPGSGAPYTIAGRRNCFTDNDGDTFAPAGAASSAVCGGCPANTTATAPSTPGTTDCNDGSGKDYISPLGVEVCSVSPEEDEDCDSVIDEAPGSGSPYSIAGRRSCYTDNDGDTFAAAGASSTTVCGGCPAATTATAPSTPSTTDCNDSAGKDYISPLGVEVCSVSPDEDEDCDSRTDEAPGSGVSYTLSNRLTCYTDLDRDGFAPTSASSQAACGSCPDQTTGTAPTDASDTDCQDTGSQAAARNPGAQEVCNGIDDDCNGQADASDPGLHRPYMQMGTTYTCSGGSWSITACPADALDCPPNDLADGCETAGNTLSNCRACGASCEFRCGGAGCDEIAAISAGLSHTCAATGDGVAACWGRNDSGQLGDSSTAQRTSPVAVAGPLLNVTAIDGGGSHSCAIASPGAQVYCWGSDASGQLGSGLTSSQSTMPVPVSGTTTFDAASSISAGTDHSCGVRGGGEVGCWGSNANGKLGGLSSATQEVTPQPIFDSTFGVVNNGQQVSAGEQHTCLLRADNTVWCFGDNSVGQLGDGNAPTDTSYAVSTGLGNVSSIAAGGYHTCAIASGTVYCWGYNSSRQSGQSGAGPINTPTAVAGIAAATGLAAGYTHSCAIHSGGVLSCWGSAASGELGPSTTTNSATPVDTGLRNVVEVSAGAGYTCAVDSGGRARCFGANANGQLGTGGTSSTGTPTQINPL